MIIVKILLDGVFFQLNNTGIARVWESLVRLLAIKPDYQIFFLDRGNAPHIENVTYIPFPSFLGKDGPADSILIQNVCDQFKIDVFTSSYYTTPISTPMVLMVYDMIPEIFNFDMSQRVWMEKVTAINFAQHYICISENTRRDLMNFYPEIPIDHITVAHCGVDTKFFFKRTASEISAFKDAQNLDRPYFLFVGSRVQHKGYKNSDLFFNALTEIENADFDVFCVGGETEIEKSILDKLPSGVRCKHATLSDYDLALAYGGAICLIYPSLYEGFGMPVIEAMASGCPVITTNRGSLAEAAGDAAYLVDGTSVEEMRIALEKIRIPALRDDLQRKGLEHSKNFRWSKMAKAFDSVFNLVINETSQGKYSQFFLTWSKLRKIQANLDYLNQ